MVLRMARSARVFGPDGPERHQDDIRRTGIWRIVPAAPQRPWGQGVCRTEELKEPHVDATPHGKRARRMALVVVGGAVVLTTAVAPTAAMADEITFQNSECRQHRLGHGQLGRQHRHRATPPTTRPPAARPPPVASPANSANHQQHLHGHRHRHLGCRHGRRLGRRPTTSTRASPAPATTTASPIGVQNSDVVNIGQARQQLGRQHRHRQRLHQLGQHLQTANGGIVGSNDADTSNDSTGTATITTGAATATGTCRPTTSTRRSPRASRTAWPSSCRTRTSSTSASPSPTAAATSPSATPRSTLAGTGQVAAGLRRQQQRHHRQHLHRHGDDRHRRGHRRRQLCQQRHLPGHHRPGRRWRLLAVVFQDAHVVQHRRGRRPTAASTPCIGNDSFNGAFTGQGLVGLIAEQHVRDRQHVRRHRSHHHGRGDRQGQRGRRTTSRRTARPSALATHAHSSPGAFRPGLLRVRAGTRRLGGGEAGGGARAGRRARGRGRPPPSSGATTAG